MSFFFNDTATTEIYTLSLHDALPISFEEEETVTITPLRTFPVIRDLVTDVSYNYEKARETPAFAPPPGVKPGDYRMQQVDVRSEEHTSELQSRQYLVCRLLLDKKKIY